MNTALSIAIAICSLSGLLIAAITLGMERRELSKESVVDEMIRSAFSGKAVAESTPGRVAVESTRSAIETEKVKKIRKNEVIAEKLKPEAGEPQLWGKEVGIGGRKGRMEIRRWKGKANSGHRTGGGFAELVRSWIVH